MFWESGVSFTSIGVSAWSRRRTLASDAKRNPRKPRPLACNVHCNILKIKPIKLDNNSNKNKNTYLSLIYWITEGRGTRWIHWWLSTLRIEQHLLHFVRKPRSELTVNLNEQLFKLEYCLIWICNILKTSCFVHSDTPCKLISLFIGSFTSNN